MYCLINHYRKDRGYTLFSDIQKLCRHPVGNNDIRLLFKAVQITLRRELSIFNSITGS